MLDDNCLFCAIAEGKIPSTKVYEDENVLAFLDISPVEKGHTLVISKRVHSTALPDTPAEVLSEIFAIVKKIGVAMIKIGFGGYNVVQNNYPDAGQTVPHYHVHIIPRPKGAPQPLAWQNGAAAYAGKEDMLDMARRIREAIES